MAKWKEIENDNEKEVILTLRKDSKSITEVSEDIGKSVQTVDKIVSRLENEGLVDKEKDYLGDSRRNYITLKENNVGISRWTFQLIMNLLLIISSMIISFSISTSIDTPNLFYGTIIGVSPILVYIIYQSLTKIDRIIVRKKVSE